jgi:hypothetical protein
MHGKAAETQVLISADWIANISICGVALLVTEAINRHRKKLHAILEIIVYMGSRRPVYIKVPLTKDFRSSLITGKNTQLISNELETLLDSFCVIASLVEVAAFRVNLWMKWLRVLSIVRTS